jgi:CheY-like chemotaxis protein
MPRILIIEDEDSVREYLVHLLREAGYQVVEAANGKQGLELYRQEPSDLIITDLIMPDKDGVEVITRLRCDSPAVKIIAMSGGGRIGANSYLHIAKMMGAQGTLEKPFDKDELLKAVRDVLEQSV